MIKVVYSIFIVLVVSLIFISCSGEKEKNDKPFENFMGPKDPLLKLSQLLEINKPIGFFHFLIRHL